jgi:hypothetical protein
MVTQAFIGKLRKKFDVVVHLCHVLLKGGDTQLTQYWRLDDSTVFRHESTVFRDAKIHSARGPNLFIIHQQVDTPFLAQRSTWHVS